MKKKFSSLIPWILCGLIFYYLFSKIPPKEILQALSVMNPGQFLLYGVIYFIAGLWLDCLAIKHFISRFSTPITSRETYLIRGVSFLAMIINYHAAQGAFAIYLKKTHKAKISKTLGALVFITIADLMLVLTCSIFALPFANLPFEGLKTQILRFAPILYLGYLVWILFWKNSDKPIFNKLKKLRLINWILQHDLFFIFREANLRDYWLILLFRLPFVLLVIGSFHFGALSFDARIDWLDIYLYNPIVMLIGSLPLTPAGLGSIQLLVIELFKDHVTSLKISSGMITAEHLLFAIGLSWFVFNQILKAIFGLACLIQMSKIQSSQIQLKNNT